MKDVSLYIAVPSARDWKCQFGASIVGLVHKLASEGIAGHRFMGMAMNAMQGASCLSRARQAALNEAIKAKCTHLLMLDDDMAFPSDTVDRLLAHDKPVMAANYRRKIEGQNVPLCMGLDGQLIDSTSKSGIEEVGFVGGGIVLIELAAISHVPAPHFAVLWDESRNDYWGEDLFFCDRIRNHGVNIFVDHDLSNEVGHIGDYSFSFQK